MLKVLVTGGAGFIGANLVEGLLPLHQVVVVDNLSTGKRSNLLNGVKFYEADIKESGFEKIVAAELPDYIIHLAAQINVGASVRDPFFDMQLNIAGTLNVLEAARIHRVKKIIYASSAAVYGDPQFLPITEEHPVNPMSPYGITKHTPEHYLQVYSVNYGIKHTVLRFANVYGPRQDSTGEGGVVATFTDRLLNNGQVRIYGDGEQTRDFVFVKDVAAAIIKALTNGDNRVYNVGSGQKVTINELFKLLQTLTAAAALPVYLPARPGDIRHSVFNINKIKADLDWEPKSGLTAGLPKTIEWFQSRTGKSGSVN